MYLLQFFFVKIKIDCHKKIKWCVILSIEKYMLVNLFYKNLISNFECQKNKKNEF
jgi:hypothetical protein